MITQYRRNCANCNLRKTCRQRLATALKARFRFTLHNLFGHPLSEFAWLFGFQRLSNWLHDVTIPVSTSVDAPTSDGGNPA